MLTVGTTLGPTLAGVRSMAFSPAASYCGRVGPVDARRGRLEHDRESSARSSSQSGTLVRRVDPQLGGSGEPVGLGVDPDHRAQFEHARIARA